MSATEIHLEPMLETTMKAVIIYDDFDLAAQAKGLLENAASAADQAIQWEVIPWRLELLDLSPTDAEALRDSMDAHLIVLAIGQAHLFPPGLVAWLERWAARRQAQDAAVALFGGRPGAHSSPALTSALSALAKRFGFSFIFDDHRPAQDGPGTSAHPSAKRAVSVRPACRDILDEPA